MRFYLKRVIAIVFALTAISCSAFAHPGRTDSDGGHFDRSDGSYHYHHGYPAHDHVDGVCPFNFDDRTGWNSGSSSSSSRTKSSSASSPSKQKDGVAEEVLLLSVSAVFIVSSILHFRREQKEEREAALRKEREVARVAKLEAERREFLSLYEGHRLSEIAPPPSPDMRIGADGLPCSDGPGKWGSAFTVYVTYRGRVYHSRPVCGTACGRPVNIAQVGNYPPCGRCGRRSCADLSWYRKQKSLLLESRRLFGRSIFSDVQDGPPPRENQFLM